MEPGDEGVLRTGLVVDGKYELVRMLGEGGMGEVWEARHQRLGRRVALKFLHPDLVLETESNTRFLREAQAAAGIGSDHIVEVTDLGETPDGVPFLVMEHLDGPDLRQLIHQERGLEPPRAARLARQVCFALGAAHGQGIIHRDLKPENLMLTRSDDEGGERLKVLDFGIAKFHDLRLTATGVVLGTPAYMAPEQAMAKPSADHRVDLYATGAILYEMLTGRPPFQGPTHQDVLMQLVTTEPRPPRDLRAGIPAGLEAVVLKAMAKDPDERYATMAELAEALRPFAEGTSHTAEPERPAPDRSSPTTGTAPTALAAPASLPTGQASAIPGASGEPLGLDDTLEDSPSPAAAPPATVVAPPSPPEVSPPPAADPSPAAGPPTPSPQRGRRWLVFVAGGFAVVGVLVVVTAIAFCESWERIGSRFEERDQASELAAPGAWSLVRGGRFTMGSPASEAGHGDDETLHLVTLSRDYSLQTTEVTQDQFASVMGYNPSQNAACGGSCPVEMVSWHEAAAYCNALSQRESVTPCYVCRGTGAMVQCEPSGVFPTGPSSCPGYRLPTEAEWERAARAGHSDATYAGELGGALACESPHPVLDRIAWFCGNANGVPRPVGQLQPNRLGLYDVLGNVWEWCHGWYGPLGSSPVMDPAGGPPATHRVMRGGSAGNSADLSRAAVRGRGQPDLRGRLVGFRPARTAR